MLEQRFIQCLQTYVVLFALQFDRGEALFRRGRNNVLDIKKLITLNEPLWVYNTTEPGYFKCKVDVYYDMKEKYTFFNRYIDTTLTPWKQILEGEFFIDGPTAQSRGQIYNAMNISYQIGHPWGQQVVKYIDANNSCGVFWANAEGNRNMYSWHELRVKNSSITLGPAKQCMNEYMKVTKSTKQQRRATYSSSCQNLLIGTRYTF
uniref:Lipocalin/cytosolic fatty-acid binding domain-containing protein n=1 Tax=Amblyomma maculatum TaxID=34609 RepID=G3MR34_AMBMU